VNVVGNLLGRMDVVPVIAKDVAGILGRF
jgi:hypothetical protein